MFMKINLLQFVFISMSVVIETFKFDNRIPFIEQFYKLDFNIHISLSCKCHMTATFQASTNGAPSYIIPGMGGPRVENL